MKAARYHRPGVIAVDDVAEPIPEDGELIVQVSACGICRSDVHVVFDPDVTQPAFAPIILGHEICGTIAQLPQAKAADIQEGDRVAVVPFVFCGGCKPCRSLRPELCTNRKVLGVQKDGGLAAFVSVPVANVVKVPPAVSDIEAALLTDAVGTPFHALFAHSSFQVGDAVAVIGTGGLGLEAVTLLNFAGSSLIAALDVRTEALTRARQAGADLVLNPASEDVRRVLSDATNGEGLDLVLDTVGLPDTICLATEIVRAGGEVVVTGLAAHKATLQPSNILVRREIRIVSSFASTARDLTRLLTVQARRHLPILSGVTHRLALEEVPAAFQMLHSYGSDIGRAVVIPNST